MNLVKRFIEHNIVKENVVNTNIDFRVEDKTFKGSFSTLFITS